MALDTWIWRREHDGVHPVEILVIAAVGIVAGATNVLAGAGSLLTYPILVAVGLSPLAANVTNDIGNVPGNLSGLLGVREGLRGQRRLLFSLVPRAVVGSLIGGALLLVLPGGGFGWVAPPLLMGASLLTLAQPALVRRVGPRGQDGRRQGPMRRMIEATALYGGYFGTGIGLVYMATLGLFVDETPARLNSLKNVLQLITNGVAGVLFACFAPVSWPLAGAMAGGAVLGGQLGARLLRRVSPAALRTTVAIIGIGAAVWLLLQQLGG